MTSAIFIKDNIANRISYYHILLFLVSLPFDRFYSQLILLSFTIHTVLHLRKEQLRNCLDSRVIILQSVYLLAICSTLYTTDPKTAFSDWDKKLAIFLFPLLLSINPLDLKKYKMQLLTVFSLTCTLTITYLYAFALWIILYKDLPLLTLFSEVFVNRNFSEPVGIHPTYLSMYAALSLSCFIYMLLKESSVLKRTLYLACCFILFAGLIQLCSKSVFIALIFIINVVIPYFLMKGNKRLKFIAVTTSVSVVSVTAILSLNVLKNRLYSSLKSDLSTVSAVHEESRMLRWGSALELIRESPLTGYGSGSEISVLKDRYFKNRLYQSFVAELNAHNQYLSFLIRSGIPGLVIYLAVLAFGFIHAIKRRDIIFLSFLILISTVSLSENILDVNKGIFFYSFFFSFLIFSGNTNRSKYYYKEV